MTGLHREEWLRAAIEKLRPAFTEAGLELPERVRVSIGFPGGGSRRTRIGECWPEGAVSDGVATVFVSPILDDRSKMLGVLIHELIHASGIHNHYRNFAKYGERLGLTPPWTATGESDELKERLHALAFELGPIDHGAIEPRKRAKQTTRMVKLECPWDGYLVRTTQKWIEVGYPSCPVGHVMGPA